jgi:hypothetical protein
VGVSTERVSARGRAGCGVGVSTERVPGGVSTERVPGRAGCKVGVSTERVPGKAGCEVGVSTERVPGRAGCEVGVSTERVPGRAGCEVGVSTERVPGKTVGMDGVSTERVPAGGKGVAGVSVDNDGRVPELRPRARRGWAGGVAKALAIGAPSESSSSASEASEEDDDGITRSDVLRFDELGGGFVDDLEAGGDLDVAFGVGLGLGVVEVLDLDFALVFAAPTSVGDSGCGWSSAGAFLELEAFERERVGFAMTKGQGKGQRAKRRGEAKGWQSIDRGRQTLKDPLSTVS